MVAVPGDIAEATPGVNTKETAVLLELQTVVAVMSFTDPSVYVPVALNWTDKPAAVLALPGVSAMLFTMAGVTVSETLDEVTPANEAVIYVDPTPVPVASPFASTVAIAGESEFHATEEVMS